MSCIQKTLLLALLIFSFTGTCQAQLFDEFDKETIEGWFNLTGDGNATMDFTQEAGGFARISVDATQDHTNVWWAILKRDATQFLDLEKLKDPAYELRVEARVRLSDAPRRINFMLNTQRTTNYHEHLREYDIADTDAWHTISFTTQNFDAVPGDSVFVQFCVTDWGPDKYHVDLDYYHAEVVRVDQAKPDLGEPLPYHPPAAPIESFTNHLSVAHDSVIHSDFPDVNFNNWQVQEENGPANILTVHAKQWAVLRWDFSQYKKTKADGPGLLEITTHSTPKGGKYIEFYGEDLGVEFGKVRIIEIFEGDPAWDQKTITYNSLLQGSDYADVFNTQMIFDVELSEERGGKSFITLSRPVMQRLLDGTTKGLLIRPLGAISASIYSSEEPGDKTAPKLHFSTHH